MSAADPASADRRVAVLTAGFGISTAMWTLGYVGRLPAWTLPAPWLLGLLLVCPVVGGAMLVRRRGCTRADAAVAGTISGAINLLVLGSFLGAETPGQVRPSIGLWLPGSILVSAMLAYAGSFAGRSGGTRPAPGPGTFASIAAVSAFVLIGVGGIVTSTDTGLAVVDWPNSYGYNMFLYPFSRMTGGIYYEHAHRLFGALVGLTTLVLAVLLQVREPRAWPRRLGWIALVMVVIQGVLGGLRVTGHFTLSTSPDVMRPSSLLAMVHGVLGQLFFATLVAIAVLASPVRAGSAAAKRVPAGRRGGPAWSGPALLGAMGLQLVLGAAQRHFSGVVLYHVLLGVAVVFPLAVLVGGRAWADASAPRSVRRVGALLVAGIVVQLGSGIGAWVATSLAEGRAARGWEVALASGHQWLGAALLGSAVVLTLRAGRDAAATARTPEPGLGPAGPLRV